MIGFIDIEDGGKAKVFECSKKQFNGIKTAIADYTEDGSVFELAFKLSKTGQKAETVLSITPILKASAADKEALAKNAEPVSETFFDDAIGEPDAEYLQQKVSGYKPTPKDGGNNADPTKQF